MNLRKSLKNDYGLGLSLIFGFVGTGFLCFLIFIKKDISIQKILSLSPLEAIKTLDFIYLAIFAIMLISGFVCFAKRMMYIKSFENEYKIVEGTVVGIHYIKDRCGLDVLFQLNERVCKKHFSLFNNDQTKYVHMDSDVSLLVKENDPKKVLILDLYFD